MAEKTTELERIYTIPLRKAKDLTRSRRANHAVRDVRRFLERHMKSESIWLDNEVNQFLWARGKYSIPSRIRVRATRFSDGVVEVTLPETEATRSVREVLAERREKAAETPVLAAPAEVAEGEEAPAKGSDRPVTDVKGVGPASAEKLEKAEITTLAELAAADAAEVAKAIGQPEEKVAAWIQGAKDLLAGKEESGEGDDEAPEGGKAAAGAAGAAPAAAGAAEAAKGKAKKASDEDE